VLTQGAAGAWDHSPNRQRGTGHGSGLGEERWVVERTISWLHTNRRLERRYDSREAFLTISFAVICHKHLQHSF